MKTETRLRLALAGKLLIVFLVCLGTYQMMTGLIPGTSFTDKGLRALRYFTVLSNLLMGLAALLYGIALLRLLLHRTKRVPKWNQVLLLMGAASVGLTFLVVIGFLLPVLRVKDMFHGANLWFHLVVPLLSMGSYAFLDRFAQLKKRAIFLGALPMLLYGLFYTGNCLLNGVGEYGNYQSCNDWYHFLIWGYPVGVGIFLLLIGATVGLAAVLHRLNQGKNSPPSD